MNIKVCNFIDKLSSYTDFKNVENQYSIDFEYNHVTQNNLQLYLETMYKLRPKAILIGEAPGYNGCRWSGIPFTAEKNLKIEYVENLLFGLNNGYLLRSIKKTQSEASATIVWDYLQSVDQYPLMWNAFPFHPHNQNNTESNRKPNIDELRIGRELLEELMNMYSIEKVAALGNVAYDTLNDMWISCDKVRHPANGGKKEFIIGMNKYLDI